MLLLSRGNGRQNQKTGDKGRKASSYGDKHFHLKKRNNFKVIKLWPEAKECKCKTVIRQVQANVHICAFSFQLLVFLVLPKLAKCMQKTIVQQGKRWEKKTEVEQKEEIKTVSRTHDWFACAHQSTGSPLHKLNWIFQTRSTAKALPKAHFFKTQICLLLKFSFLK